VVVDVAQMVTELHQALHQVQQTLAVLVAAAKPPTLAELAVLAVLVSLLFAIQ
jgi:hypothetical protein